jgi:hypothetical protein
MSLERKLLEWLWRSFSRVSEECFLKFLASFQLNSRDLLKSCVKLLVEVPEGLVRRIRRIFSEVLEDLERSFKT